MEIKKPRGCRRIYLIKYWSDGALDWYKARMVAKGYTQTYGIDYKERFALVTKMNIVRILLSPIAYVGWELHQFYVKNACPRGDLEEELIWRFLLTIISPVKRTKCVGRKRHCMD